MDILMSETCWAHNKWNKIASDIKLVFHSSTNTNVITSPCIVPNIFVRFQTNLDFVKYINKSVQYQIWIKFVQWWQTWNVERDTTKVIGTYRLYANSPRNYVLTRGSSLIGSRFAASAATSLLRYVYIITHWSLSIISCKQSPRFNILTKAFKHQYEISTTVYTANYATEFKFQTLALNC